MGEGGLTPGDVLTIINTIGFPLLIIYAHFRGWVVTPRELDAAVSYAKSIEDRYLRLETEISAERAETRRELQETRGELRETREMLIRALANDGKLETLFDRGAH